MLRLKGSTIQSLMPAIDARADEAIRVLGGRNIAWDSKGPISGFATREMSHSQLGNQFDAQGFRVGPYTLVFSAQQILEWSEDYPRGWMPKYAFTTLIPAESRAPWQGIFLNDKIYLAQMHRGFFSGAKSVYGPLALTYENDTTIPGLIPNVQGLATVRGRAILVNETTIQWSAVGDLTTLAPSLGGPGFQAISQITDGTFLGLATFQDSFVVWTAKGAIVADYIGGDATWRFDKFSSTDRPIDRNCLVQALNGNIIFLSQQGLQIMSSAAGSEPFSADFNEFFRGYVEDSSDTERQWRVDYDIDHQRIFISESVNLSTYAGAFVYYPTLNKWGVFSDEILGFAQLTDTRYGYFDLYGVAHYFLNTVNRGVHPESELGLNRVRARMERVGALYSRDVPPPANGFVVMVANSSVVSNAYETTSPDFGAVAITADRRNKPGHDYWAWPYSQDFEHAGALIGMDSEVEIGYIRAQEITQTNMGVTSIQSVMVGSYLSMPAVGIDSALIDRNAEALTYTIDDWNLGGTDEDWNLAGTDEDWNDQLSPLMWASHQFAIQTSDDGIMVDNPVFALSQFYIGGWFYTMNTTAVFNRLVFSALEAGEYFHIRYLELNVNYGGENP